MTRTTKCLVTLVACALALAGCEKDTVAPDPGPGGPAGLVDDFEAAVSAEDLAACADLLHEDFAFLLLEDDISPYPRAASDLTQNEFLRSLDGFFAGVNATNFNGDVSQAFTHIELRLDEAGDWTRLPADDPDFALAFAAEHDAILSMTSSLGVDYDYGGRVDLYLAAVDSTATDAGMDYDFALLGLRDRITHDAADGSIGRLLLAFLTNRAPTISLDISPTGGPVSTRFTFDATGTTDADGDAIEYRWAFALGTWYNWGSDNLLLHAFSGDGTKNISVQARDRWSESAVLSAEIVVTENPRR